MAHRRQNLAPSSAGGASAAGTTQACPRGPSLIVSSTMSAAEVDANVSEIPARIAELGQRVLDGGQVTRDEALELFALEAVSYTHLTLPTKA